MGRRRNAEDRGRRLRIRSTAGAVLGCLTLLAAPTLADKFEPKTAPFAIAFRNVVSPYRDFSIFVLPDEKVLFEATGGPSETYTLKTDTGIVEQFTDTKWRWTAPSVPGTYRLKFTASDPPHESLTLHAFVLVPFAEVKSGWLNGYRIGDYPPPLKDNPIYQTPRGFVEVTHENHETRLSPHFRLKQFICKEDTTKKYPKYVIVQEPLLLKLEGILEDVNTKLGVHVDTLHIMSAYRTPYYNHAIGDVKYSMHQFGSAADIYIDPGDHDRMADLNHDHAVDINDSLFLYDRIEELLATKPFSLLQGGMGYYPATGAHPPFVHVDVRGTKARWRG